MDSKYVKDLSVEEFKEIIKEALIEALGVKGTEEDSEEEGENLLEEEFRLNIFENEDDEEGGVA